MDFIVDGLATGRMVRILSVFDAYTRECLALERGHQLGQRTGDAGAGAADRRARPAAECTFRQQAEVHLAADARLGRGAQDCAGSHPAGPADAERTRRELQRQAARRVPQHKLVPHSERRAGDAGELAARVQLRTPAQLAGLQNAGGVPAEGRLCRCGKQRTLPTSAQPRLLRLRDNLKAKPKRENSSYRWLREWGQVTTPNTSPTLVPSIRQSNCGLDQPADSDTDTGDRRSSTVNLHGTRRKLVDKLRGDLVHARICARLSQPLAASRAAITGPLSERINSGAPLCTIRSA